MSIKIMSAVYDSDLSDIYEVSVLLALANHADDDGWCYPSIPRIARLSRCGERAVFSIIARLEATGHLRRIAGGGRGKSNRYQVIPNPAPQTLFEKHGTENTVSDDKKTLHRTTKNPAPGAPETSVTIKEPSLVSEAREIEAVLHAIASPEAVSSFIAYRRKTKHPVTLTAAKRLATNLRAIMAKGADPDDALAMAEDRGWRTVEADWYFNAKGQGNGNGNRGAENPGDHRLRIYALAAQSR